MNLTHYMRMMPYLLLGQAGGKLKTGRNLVYDFDKTDSFAPANGLGPHHTQLLVSMLNLMGIPDTKFGDPTSQQGPLPNLV